MILELIHIFGPSSQALKINKWKRFFQALLCLPLWILGPIGFLIEWFILEMVTRNEWKRSGLERIIKGSLGSQSFGVNYTTGIKRKISKEEESLIRKSYPQYKISKKELEL